MNPLILVDRPASNELSIDERRREAARAAANETMQQEDDRHFREAQTTGWSMIGAVISRAVGR